MGTSMMEITLNEYKRRTFLLTFKVAQDTKPVQSILIKDNRDNCVIGFEEHKEKGGRAPQVTRLCYCEVTSGKQQPLKFCHGRGEAQLNSPGGRARR